MRFISKVNHFCESFYPRLYAKGKGICFLAAFILHLIITSVLYFLWLETINLTVIVIAAAVNGWTMMARVPKSKKEHEQFLAMQRKYVSVKPSKQVTKVNILKFLSLTVIVGASIDLLINHLASIGYDTSLGVYKFIYFFGYLLAIPLLVAITNWEHIGTVYERYVTRNWTRGKPWFYPLGFIASLAYASFSNTSGIIMALLLSFGTVYHIYHSIPPVVKDIKK